MTLGALGFMSPWLLLALASLPVLYWLLRTVPPRPRAIAFPPTRMLKDLENREQTPERTPWWLMLIRMLAAALVILALAEPVLNPKRSGTAPVSGPMLIVIDNDWAAAGKWQQRIDMLASLLAEAEAGARPVLVVPTAMAPRAGALKLESPRTARETVAAIKPEPYAPRRMETIAEIEKALGGQKIGNAVWLADGLDHGQADAFARGLMRVAGGAPMTVYSAAAGEEPLGLGCHVGTGGRLIADIRRAEGEARGGAVQAWSARGQRLGETTFRLGPGETKAEVLLDMPLELRNQVARLDIAGLPSAGAVCLLDSRSRWHRIGLVASTSREQAQPLLAPLYYINKALAPFAEIVTPKEGDATSGLEHVLAQNASLVVLADVGKLVGPGHERADEWVKKGGVLVRFAGPRLEQASDDLMPVSLRAGGRTLGGALSWATPQPLAPFENESLFAGLPVPAEVLVTRQVLADPARLGDPGVKVWAKLKDGTPLVTAAKRGEGWVVLFHVTANSDWSNLPLSGLFVEMLRRLMTLTQIAGTPAADRSDGSVTADPAKPAAREAGSADVLAPVETLNGFGELKSPPATALAVRASQIGSIVPSHEHPPGLYGPAAAARALNLIEQKTVLRPLPALPAGASRAAYAAEKARPLKPELMTLALALLFVDIVAVVLLQLGGAFRRRPVPAQAAMLLLSIGVGLVFAGEPAQAQGQGQRPADSAPQSVPPPVRKPEDDFALKAALKTRLAYVRSGDEAVDRTSLIGLQGLTTILTQRTAIEPGEPVGVDIDRDELAYFPILYWPVLPGERTLSAKTLAKIDAFMKQGGLIIFDTRDFAQSMPTPNGPQGPGSRALQRLVGSLDIPRLEPVPEGHVLTKSFYLLRTFPGRWEGGQTWVEAGTEGDKSDPRRARRADGVSSIIITPNDLAAAWAIDARGRGLYPAVPGGELQREMAFRTGVNIVMYALTGNYKADQVHVPALLERLGQ